MEGGLTVKLGEKPAAAVITYKRLARPGNQKQ
jgi:hypothetical protein